MLLQLVGTMDLGLILVLEIYRTGLSGNRTRMDGLRLTCTPRICQGKRNVDQILDIQ